MHMVALDVCLYIYLMGMQRGILKKGPLTVKQVRAPILNGDNTPQVLLIEAEPPRIIVAITTPLVKLLYVVCVCVSRVVKFD